MALAGLAALAGCGGGERQDADEPEGEFQLQLVDASFPSGQRLAKRSTLQVTVRNPGERTVPNVAVAIRGLDYRTRHPEVSDPKRPRFVLNSIPKRIGGFPDVKTATPPGCETAYVGTWACGPLEPGAEATFRWSVTAVRAGPYRIAWRTAAGLDGRARAVSPGGDPAPHGAFAGRISDAVPEKRVAADGRTVVTDPADRR